MDIELLKRTIRSNLVSYGLLPQQIEEIVNLLADDIMKLVSDDYERE